MDVTGIQSSVRRLWAIPPIGILGNLVGAGLTFVYFALIAPGVAGSQAAHGFWDRAAFVGLVIACIFPFVMPFNARFFWPLARKLKRIAAQDPDEEPEPSRLAKLSLLAGKIMDLPVKLAISTSAIWIGTGLIFVILPVARPGSCPWDPIWSHEMGVGMLLVGAPVTLIHVYFVEEWWLRSALRRLPAEALRSVPPSLKINVLPKILLVSLTLGTLPVVVMGHVTLSQIHEIEAGRQSLAGFVSQTPTAIGFLVCFWVLVGVGLSVLMAESVSEPLRQAGSVMDKMRGGDLNAGVKVVSNDEIGVMGEGFNRMTEGLRERDAIKDTFGRYLSKEVVNEILKSPGGIDLEGQLRDITILVSDLRGFTSMTDVTEPRLVLRVLNRYLERMTEIIISHEGTIDEFTGDGILVFFGAPRTLPNHAERAVECALEMQKAMSGLNEENRGLGLPGLEMGIAINTGELIVGNIGSEKRKKYGAIGTPINVAFRVESLSAARDILITGPVYERLTQDLETAGKREVSLKGIDHPMTVYQVLGMQSNTV